MLNIRAGCLFLVFLLVAFSSNAQEKFTINGYIEDSKTGERLLGANVYDLKDKVGTSTNTYGFYSITLPAGDHELRISYVGCSPIVKKITLNKDVDLNIKLDPIIFLEEAVVNAEKVNKIQERSDMSVIEIPIETIKKIPALFGEVDVIKALQLLPGVQSGGEGSSGLYVRGGGPDQNLILLDGVPVYNASHLFGFFSVFNADAISNVKLIKGGYPARYGGRLSSVLDIGMKEGNNQEFHGEGSIGLISSKLTLEGPIKKEKTSFIISARRTYIDLLAQPIIRLASEGNGSGGYFFYDLNAKVNHKISDKDKIYFSIYNGKDKFYFRERNEDALGEDEFKGALTWGNITSALRYNRKISNKMFANLTATYSNYEFDISSKQKETYRENGEQKTETFELRYFSGIRDWALKVDFDYLPDPNHFIKFGISSTAHKFKPDAIQQRYETPDFVEDTTIRPSEQISAIESMLYIEDDWKISKKLKANVGLHLSHFNVKGTNYFNLQPRFSARYLLPDDVALKASFATMQQYIHLLSNSGISLPTDLWVPVTDKIKPQRSIQVAVGAAKGILDNKYELSLEGYYRKMTNLIEYKNGESFIGASDWQQKVETNGEGWAYGAELFFQKKYGKTTGWVGYTLAWSNRRFDNLNFGNKYPYRYDRRHDFSAVAVHKFNERVEVSATWVYGTGNAVTFPLQIFNQSPQSSGGNSVWSQDLRYFGERNSFRMKAYHRLDMAISLSKPTKWGTQSWNFGLYNAYSRRNPYFIYLNDNVTYDRNGTAIVERQARQVSLFPILPSVAYNFKF